MNIKAKFDHFNINVSDLNRSIAFYDKALGLKEKRRIIHPDGAFIIVYLTDEQSDFVLELTWLRNHQESYNLGDNESHLCVRIPGNYDDTKKYHKEMGCICFENQEMGLYFINDPDDYWIEVLPLK